MALNITKFLMVILLICILCPGFLFATAQIPDIIIFNNDTLLLMCNPLEAFFNESDPRPYPFFDDDIKNTGCWRGYQAWWEVKDSALYLIEVRNCNKNEKLDLQKIFGPAAKFNKIRADWYNGKLCVPKGKMINYFHAGYESIFEKEIIFEIRRGRIVYFEEFRNIPDSIPPNFTVRFPFNFNIVLPDEIQYNDETDYDFCYSDSLNTLKFYGSYIDLEEIDSTGSPVDYVEITLDIFSHELIDEFFFDTIQLKKLQRGMNGWIDGVNLLKNERLRLFVAANSDQLLLIYFLAKNRSEQEFQYFTKHIFKFIRFRETCSSYF